MEDNRERQQSVAYPNQGCTATEGEHEHRTPISTMAGRAGTAPASPLSYRTLLLGQREAGRCLVLLFVMRHGFPIRVSSIEMITSVVHLPKPSTALSKAAGNLLLEALPMTDWHDFR